jgi:hypothetical protein
MDYQIPTLEDHLNHIQAVRKKMLQVSTFLLVGEFLCVLCICSIAWALFTVYSHWETEVLNFGTYMLVALSILAGTLVAVPVCAALLCEFRRDALKRDVAMSEMRIDIASGVSTAVREFFGSSLPQYSKHFTGLGLAEELLSISRDMSAHNERAYHVTTQALQLLEKNGGIAGIKQEALKAGYLTTLMTGILDVLSRHEDVLQANEIDDEIEQVVIDFKKHLLAAE